MLETVNILTGSTFVTSDRLGDIDGSPTSPHGLFASDTRFLSKWKMAIDERPLAVLSVDEEHYYATQFFLAPSTGTTYVDSPMSVLRRRSIGDSMWEEIRAFQPLARADRLPPPHRCRGGFRRPLRSEGRPRQEG